MDDAFTFDNQAQAKEAAAILINNGYAATVHDESQLQKYFHLTDPIAAAKLDVESSQLEEVTRFFRKRIANGDPVFQAAWRCPECGGFQVQYPQFSRKSVLPAISMDLLAAGKLVDRTCYCQECHATWKPEVNRAKKENSASEEKSHDPNQLKDVAL